MPRALPRSLIPLLVAAFVTLAVSGVTWWLDGRPVVGVDDANITMVYGRNLSAGHGFVFTPGHERVEGSSSLAWTLVAAAAWGTPWPEGTLLLLSLLLTWGTVFLALQWAPLLAKASSGGTRSETRRRRGLLVALSLWGLASPGFFEWSAFSLMDLALWALLLNLAFLQIARRTEHAIRKGRDGNEQGPRTWPVSVTLTALVFARPEGLALGPLLGVMALRVMRGGPRRRVGVPALALVGVPLGAALALTGWRLAWFGFPLPNTWYAKVAPSLVHNLVDGAQYLGRGLLGQPALLVLLLASGAVVAAHLGRLRLDRRTPLTPPVLAAVLFLLGMALPLVSGGDHFPRARFLQPFVWVGAMPVLGWWMERHTPPDGGHQTGVPRPARGGAVLVGVLLLLLATPWAPYGKAAPLALEFRLAADGRSIGEALPGAVARRPGGDAPTLQSLPSVGVIVAGGVGLTYPGRVLDLMGLNWVAMGHSPGERHGPRNHAAFHVPTFLEAPPDLLLPKWRADPPLTSSDLVTAFERRCLKGLLEEPGFRAAFVPAWIPHQGRALSGWFRRDWLDHNPQVRAQPLGAPRSQE